MSAHVFLSHSHKDKSFARKLAVDLMRRGIHVWIDEGEIAPGDSLISKIESAIDNMDYVIVVLSPNSVSSDWVIREVRMALHREIGGKRVIVIPVLYKDCEIPGFLRDKLYADFRDDSKFHSSVNNIIRSIKGCEHKDSETEDAFAELQKLEITQLWEAALNTGVFSKRFWMLLHGYLRDIPDNLQSLPPNTAAYYMATGLSYVWFLRKLSRQGKLNKMAIEMLSIIVENEHIAIYLRNETLVCILSQSEAIIGRLKNRLQKVLTAICSDENFASHIIQKYFPLQVKIDQNNRTENMIDVLERTLQIGDVSCHCKIVQMIKAYFEASLPDNATSFDSFFKDLSSSKYDRVCEILKEMRVLWYQLRAISEVEKSYIDNLLSLLWNDKAALGKEEEIVQLFRDASVQTEQGNPYLYSQVMDLLSQENISVIRQLQGDEYAYHLLAKLVYDPNVQEVFSLFALALLVQEFGGRALALDEHLLKSMFKPKIVGPHRTNLIQALCESLIVESDFLSTNLFLEIYSLVQESERDKLMKILEKYCQKSKRALSLLKYLKGEIDKDSMVSTMERY